MLGPQRTVGRTGVVVSHAAGIEVTYESPDVPVLMLLESLERAGWSFQTESEVHYLLDENEMFDWRWEASSRWDDVKVWLEQHHHRNRYVGVSMVYGRSGSGGELLFYPHAPVVSVSLTIGRRQLRVAPPFTDMSWYLGRLLPPLAKIGPIALLRTTDHR